MLIVPNFQTKKALKTELKAFGVNSLLSVGSDSKTVKGEKLGFNTAILYMQPNLKICPASKMAGCFESCLVSAGRGSFNNVKQARANKTNLFNIDKGLFFSALISEIETLYKKHSDSLVVRLNGTSDIDYENISFNYKSKDYKNIFEYFSNSNIQFYDYTKRIKRLQKTLPKNYDLTISYSGKNHKYAVNCLQAHSEGHKIAVVFDDLEKATSKDFNFYGGKVINGDNTDLRFLDSKGSIIGLSAKGKAKKDQSGFVQRLIPTKLI